jgi:hypothetical protein
MTEIREQRLRPLNCTGIQLERAMQRDSHLAIVPISVRLRVTSRTPAGLSEAREVIDGSAGVSVVEELPCGELSRCFSLMASSVGVVSRLAYRIANIGVIDQVSVQRCPPDRQID